MKRPVRTLVPLRAGQRCHGAASIDLKKMLLQGNISIMKTASLTPRTEADVRLHILHPDRELPPRVARAILGLSFPKHEMSRMHELSAKARTGTLTPEEDAEMDVFERVGSMLSTLKSRARQVLKRSSRSA